MPTLNNPYANNNTDTDQLIGGGLKSYFNPQDDAANQSPEATGAEQQGGSLNTAPPPATPTQTSATATTRTPLPTTGVTAPQTFNVPVQLTNKSNFDQARTLGDFLKAQGVQSGPMVVGGNSPYDHDILGIIDKINAPATTAPERRIYAQDLVTLIGLRSKSATGALFTYDPVTGQFSGPPTTGTGTQTTTDLISKVGHPDSTAVTAAIAALQNGVSPDIARLQTSQLVSGVEGNAANHRQQLADALGASNISGGHAASLLTGEDAATSQALATGEANIGINQLNQQQTARQGALNALLGQEGINQGAATSEAGLAVNQSQFGQNLDYASSAQSVTNRINLRQQDLTTAIALLTLAQNGDEAAAQRATTLLIAIGAE